MLSNELVQWVQVKIMRFLAEMVVTYRISKQNPNQFLNAYMYAVNVLSAMYTFEF